MPKYTQIVSYSLAGSDVLSTPRNRLPPPVAKFADEVENSLWILSTEFVPPSTQSLTLHFDLLENRLYILHNAQIVLARSFHCTQASAFNAVVQAITRIINCPGLYCRPFAEIVQSFLDFLSQQEVF